jgi:hypothetical protein
MDTALPFAGVLGLAAGAGCYLLVPDPLLALGTTGIYAGAAHFYLASDVALLDAEPRFDDRVDRLGYAVGLFGPGVSPSRSPTGTGPTPPSSAAAGSAPSRSSCSPAVPGTASDAPGSHRGDQMIYIISFP